MPKFRKAAAFLILLLSTTALVQAATSPAKIGFQGKLLDTSNNPKNGTFGLTFKIFDAPTGGNQLWTETQSNVSVANGVFSAELGAVNALNTSLFLHASSYLEITVDSDPAMTPRQALLMTGSAFRALYAEKLASGDTDYVQVRDTLQAGAQFHVASATVAGPFLTTGVATFTAVGNQTYSLVTSSGLRVMAGTLRVEGEGIVATEGVVAATFTALTGIVLPQGSALTTEGAMRWEPTQNLVFVGTGTSNKTLADTDSAQTLTNKTLSSTGGNTVDATKIRTRDVDATAPANGAALVWHAGLAQWTPVYAATVTVVSVPWTPNATFGNGTMLADLVHLVPFNLTGTMSLNQIRYRVGTGVGGCTGDVGIYDTGGRLVASGGANSADYTTAAAKAVAMQGAPKVLQPGQYYFAMSGTGGTPRVRGVDLAAASAGVVKGLGNISCGAGGCGSTLPATVNLGGLTDGNLIPFMSANE